jgi:hypothetical protein
MVTELTLYKQDKEVLIQILESQPSKSVGELRKIDKLCTILEKQDDKLLIDDELFTLAKQKINSFEGQFISTEIIRKKILRVADILDGNVISLDPQIPTNDISNEEPNKPS